MSPGQHPFAQLSTHIRALSQPKSCGTQEKALRAITAKVKTACRHMDTNQPLDILLIHLNRILRGWCAYFRPGVSSKTFGYLAHFTWWQVLTASVDVDLALDSRR